MRTVHELRILSIVTDLERSNELRLSDAARLLGVHVATLRAWCQAALAYTAWVDGGCVGDTVEPSRLAYARRSPTGRYYVDRAEVEALERSAGAPGATAARAEARALRAEVLGPTPTAAPVAVEAPSGDAFATLVARGRTW